MSKKFSIENLRANWYVPLSALILFVMQSEFKVIPYAGVIAAFVSWVIFCAYVSPSDLWKISEESKFSVKIFSCLTALGVCIFSHTFLYERMLLRRDLFDKLLGLLHIPENIFYYFLFTVSLLSSVFVYLYVNYFWEKFLKLIRSNGVFHDIGRAEMLFYFMLFAATVLFVTAAFIKSDAFYGANIEIDTIYTGDAGGLIGRNCFLNIPHVHNDNHQPLFGVFALPFIGAPYLFARLLAVFSGHREFLTALFMNYAQIAMLIAGIFLLAKSMKLSPLYRVLFALCFSCSYVYLLAVLMMEQYIVVFFWLSLCVCFVCADSKPDRMILYGAGGTLTTSLILAPFFAGRKILRGLWRFALEFLALMVLFSRAGVILTLVPDLLSILPFTGIGKNYVPLIDRVKQYSEFLYYSFFSPCAGFHSHAGLNMEEFNSWQLYRIESINYIGLAILALALFSAFINRKSKICRVSFMWVILSFIVLCAIGWGTAENGLILYSLYFSWAFYILIFMLILKAEELSGVKILVPLLAVAALCVFVRFSFPAINELADFAAKYYPYSW